MHIDSRPQPDPSAHKLSIFILIYGVHCWDIVAGRGRWGSVTWVGFISCKNGYKNSFSFLAFVAKVPHEICCCCTIAFKFTSPPPPLLLSHLAIFFSPASCPIHFVKLLPFKSETNDESKIYVKYVWQHFQKKAPAALPTSPFLSLSLLW